MIYYIYKDKPKYSHVNCIEIFEFVKKIELLVYNSSYFN